MTAVLVSGAEAHVVEVAAALRARGASVIEVTDLGDLPAVCAAAGSAAFDAYVQLAATFSVTGETAVQRVHDFYAGGVLARFRALDAALPALAPGSRAVFVLGQLPPEVASPTDREARYALTRVLAQAACADSAGGRLGACILDAGSGAARIAAVALGEDPAQQELLDRLAELRYADWRVELLGLAVVET
jgi:hypothetical protein